MQTIKNISTFDLAKGDYRINWAKTSTQILNALHPQFTSAELKYVSEFAPKIAKNMADKNFSSMHELYAQAQVMLTEAGVSKERQLLLEYCMIETNNSIPKMPDPLTPLAIKVHLEFMHRIGVLESIYKISHLPTVSREVKNFMSDVWEATAELHPEKEVQYA